MKRSRSSSGFTLIELLVVISIVSLLVAMMLPALGRARASNRDVQCRSNLRQMQIGWLSYITDSAGRIPYTQSSDSPNWKHAMNSVMPNMPSLWDFNGISANTCPAVQTTYAPMYYFLDKWGYAINYWWSNVPPEINEGKNWSAIRSPSQYPWFLDPLIYPFSSGYTAVHEVPHTSYSDQAWGVGAHHGGGQRFNSSFADGSARSVALEELLAGSVGPNDFEWFTHD